MEQNQYHNPRKLLLEMRKVKCTYEETQKNQPEMINLENYPSKTRTMENMSMLQGKKIRIRKQGWHQRYQEQNSIFKKVKEKTCKPRILCPVKLSFKGQDYRKTAQNVQDLGQYCTPEPFLRNILVDEFYANGRSVGKYQQKN